MQLIKTIKLIILLVVPVGTVRAQTISDTEIAICKYPTLSVEPEFVGSGRNLEEYIYKHLEYPKKAKRKKTTGKVKASFTIERDGTISNIIILESLPNGCDEAVINLIKRMPKWRPAMKNGNLVRFFYELSVEFGLEFIEIQKRINDGTTSKNHKFEILK